MAKRKREENGETNGEVKKVVKAIDPAHESSKELITVQIITGSYERVLHGITAAISLDVQNESPSVQFTDTFLFNAHASAIRALALSPLSEQDSALPQKVILASGGTDERINLYQLSASPPSESDKLPSIPTLAGNKILENPRNRELGSLLHHSSSITALYFPTRSKLLSAAEDNTISVSRMRDLSLVSTIKAPLPKSQGRPSGDTAPLGGAPAGVNDFAVHPSMKVMISVGKGERCVRLWNLLTGKKAGVLNFGRDVLQSVKEGKWSSGEGRKVEWNNSGEEYAVAFERGAVVFGIDAKPRCSILPAPLTKLHQMRYITLPPKDEGLEGEEVVAVSTEDGRVVFYPTGEVSPTYGGEPVLSPPAIQAIAHLGGKSAGISGRIKDFEILHRPSASGRLQELLVVTSSSDGNVTVWTISLKDLSRATVASVNGPHSEQIDDNQEVRPSRQTGTLLGTYETNNRITCLKAFVMLPSQDDDQFEESGLESGPADEEDSSESSDGE